MTPDVNAEVHNRLSIEIDQDSPGLNRKNNQSVQGLFDKQKKEFD